VNKEK
jgi:hypothetical protein